MAGVRRLVTVLLACLGFAGGARAACSYSGEAATVDLPGQPFAVDVSADGCTLFAALTPADDGGANGIAVLEAADGGFRLARVIPLAGDPAGLALTPDGKTLVVANGDDIALLDVARLRSGEGDPVLGRVPEAKGVESINVAVSRDGRLLFAAEERGERLLVADVARARAGQGSAAIVGYVPTGRAPVGLAISPDGRRLYATSQIAPASLDFPVLCRPPSGAAPERPLGALLVVDVARAATDPETSVVAVAAAGCSPVRVALSPDGATAWVTARSDNALLAFETARLGGVTKRAPAAVAVGAAPVGLAVRPDGAQVWVGNSDRFSKSGAGSLSRVTPGVGVEATVATGRFPRHLRFLPDGRTLVVAQFGSQAIQFVPTPP